MEKLPNAFNDAAQATRSHVEAANTPACIEINEQPATIVAPKAKRGPPPGAEDKTPSQEQTSHNQPAHDHY